MTHPSHRGTQAPTGAVPTGRPSTRPTPGGSGAPAGVPGQPSVPAQPHPAHVSPASPAPPAPPAAVSPRRSAWAEGTDRLRAAATTEPGRLRIIGAVLALLVVGFGAVASWQVTDRATAADDVLHRSQPLASEAAAVYRSLADANTAASSGFLAGGQEPAQVIERYRRDIDTASEKLAAASAGAEPGSASAAAIADLNQLLPRYTGLVERARANNRQGLPLGGAYLRYANDTMQTEMLPAAEKLYTSENARLRADYDGATPYPWVAIGVGTLVLAALAWAQRRNYLRTNRVFNHGLLAATAASTVVLLWLVIGHSVARSGLNDSYEHGVRSLNALNDARLASLKARGNENLTLVSRGAETVTVKDVPVDKYDAAYNEQMGLLAGTEGRPGLLAAALDLADDADGRTPVSDATDAMKVWQERHGVARDRDNAGDYQGALDKIIGTEKDKPTGRCVATEDRPTGECFDAVDAALEKALAHEQGEFKKAVGHAPSSMNALALGAAALALLAAAFALLGIGRRLSEYR
ncbi:hypothetical protein [Streptomyces sp. NPDC059816]|uniref:hypothetical protein n=1 Tax=Streptomyces sp. NPDC059816 TaxID=3346960 RepID=UPI00365834BE